jgi:hypothetical protein
MVNFDNLTCNSAFTDNDAILNSADCIHDSLVEALRISANIFIPKQRKNFYELWWSQELDVLKTSAMCLCRAWKDSGKPRNGPIFSEYKKCKLLYKKRLREEKAAEFNAFTNDLHDALLRKSGQDFWRTWKSKFRVTLLLLRLMAPLTVMLLLTNYQHILTQIASHSVVYVMKNSKLNFWKCVQST